MRFAVLASFSASEFFILASFPSTLIVFWSVPASDEKKFPGSIWDK